MGINTKGTGVKKRSKAKQCEGKVGYLQKGLAIAESQRRMRRFGALRHHATAYRCPHCGRWHVGHLR